MVRTPLKRPIRRRDRSKDRAALEHASKPVPWAVSEWEHRRKRLDLTLLFLALIVVVAVANEIAGMWLDKKYEGNGILQSVALTSLTSMVALITAYVGFASWDDKNSKQTNLDAMQLELEHVAATEADPVAQETTITTTSAVTKAESTTTKPVIDPTPEEPVADEPVAEESETDPSANPPSGYAQ